MNNDERPVVDRDAEVSMRERASKPTHYKTVCVSLYTRDLDDLKSKVAELKRRGLTKASASWLIRLALSRLDIETIAVEDRP
jgi:hypothetical protein